MTYPRTWAGDLLVSLHWPRAACFYAFIVWGAMLAPVIHWDRLALALLAVFFYLQLAAYAMDLLRGNHIGQTHFSRLHLKVRATIGIAGASVIATYLILTVSPWLLPLWVVGVLGIVGYNYEVLGGWSRRLMFALVWGAFPVLSHYVLMTPAFPSWWVWAFALAAAVFAEMHVTSYGLFACRLPKEFCCSSEGKWSCHGMHPLIRRWLGEAGAETVGPFYPRRAIHRLAKRQSNLQVAFLLLLTGAFGAWRLTG